MSSSNQIPMLNYRMEFSNESFNYGSGCLQHDWHELFTKAANFFLDSFDDKISVLSNINDFHYKNGIVSTKMKVWNGHNKVGFVRIPVFGYFRHRKNGTRCYYSPLNRKTDRYHNNFEYAVQEILCKYERNRKSAGNFSCAVPVVSIHDILKVESNALEHSYVPSKSSFMLKMMKLIGSVPGLNSETKNLPVAKNLCAILKGEWETEIHSAYECCILNHCLKV